MTGSLNIYRQIIVSYMKNKYFLVSSLLAVAGYVFALPVAKGLEMPYFNNGGPIVTIYFVECVVMVLSFFLTLGWPGLLGSMLKSQFAHPRAVLCPDFRLRHIVVAFIFFVLYEILMGLTMVKLMSHYSSEGYTLQFTLILVLVSLVSVWLGYLFHFGGIGISLALLSLFLRLLINPSPQVFLNAVPSAGALSLIAALAMIFLVWRLWTLREGSWEYRITQTSWDLKEWGNTSYYSSEISNGKKFSWFSALFRRKDVEISAYPYQSNIFKRARHWLLPYGTGRLSFWGLFGFVSLALFILLISNAENISRIFSKIDVPIRVFIPLMILMQSFPSLIRFEDALSRPLSRKRIVFELGFAQGMLALQVFAASILIFGIIPILVHQPSLLLRCYLWIDIGIVFAVSVFSLGLYAVLGKLLNSYLKQVIPVLVVMALVFFLLEWLKHLPSLKILAVCVALGLSGVIFLRIAYCLWCRLKAPDLKKRIAINLAGLLLLGAATVAFLTHRPVYAQIIDYPDYVVYVPEHLDYGVSHPLVVALSPSGNAREMLKAWKGTADQFKWIVLASKRFRNGIDWYPEVDVFRRIKTDVVDGKLSLPIDTKRVIASGISGGAWGSYDFIYIEPDFISGLVLNTGMMNDCYMTCEDNRYPFDRFAVFLASPSDFRYKEMQLNQEFLKVQGWETEWIEFEGGHTFAPRSAYSQAAAWIMEQWKKENVNPGGKL